MDFAEGLRMLEAAQGDRAKLALTTVDLAYPSLPDAERLEIKQCLEAAAIPHWCDEAILSAVLKISKQESASRLARLRGLSVVEPFPARGEMAMNVHESSRLALRRGLAAVDETRFRVLSLRAAAHFAEDFAPAGRVEWIYQLLCGDPKRGATELESLERDWVSCARPEDRYALASALRELEDTELVQGVARVWALLVTAWVRVSRGETAQLADGVGKILDLARVEQDVRAEADAQCLLGAVLQAQGKLEAALAAFGENLAISRRLAEQDPSNAGWQRELAVAYSWVGGVLQAQGKLEAAQGAFGENLTINRRLAEQDPGNAGWQRELAGTYNSVGEVLQAQGQLEAAKEAFVKNLAILQRLTEQDPSNAGWLRDLAVAHNRVGGALQAQGKLEAAQEAFGEDLAISWRLAEQDPSNAGWQRDLAVAYRKVGEVLQSRGKLDAAKEAFGKNLMISRRLAEHDPGNAEWQRDLALVLWRIAQLEANADGHAAALPLYEEASRIFRILAESAPGFVQWSKDKEDVDSELSRCRSVVSVPNE